MGWVEIVACIGEIYIYIYTNLLLEHPKRRDHLEDLVVDGRIILN
jgi:hypothetical protein